MPLQYKEHLIDFENGFPCMATKNKKMFLMCNQFSIADIKNELSRESYWTFSHIPHTKEHFPNFDSALI